MPGQVLIDSTPQPVTVTRYFGDGYAVVHGVGGESWYAPARFGLWKHLPDYQWRVERELVAALDQPSVNVVADGTLRGGILAVLDVLPANSTESISERVIREGLAIPDPSQVAGPANERLVAALRDARASGKGYWSEWNAQANAVQLLGSDLAGKTAPPENNPFLASMGTVFLVLVILLIAIRERERASKPMGPVQRWGRWILPIGYFQLPSLEPTPKDDAVQASQGSAPAPAPEPIKASS